MHCKLLSAAGFIALFTVATAPAANFFFSFDTATDGTGGFDPAVTANDGFVGTPTATQIASVTTTTGGEASFQDFQGTVWSGSGTSNTPGRSLAWNPGSNNNAFELTFSTIGLEDFSLRFAVRSAQAAGGSAPTSFDSFTYNIGAGPVAVPGGNLGAFAAGNVFGEYAADLSALDAIEGQPSVTLRWTIENLPSSPAESFRIDNIQASATAVPEPATGFLLLVGFGLSALRRARR